MICSECDAQNRPGDKYCEQCGARLGDRGHQDLASATLIAAPLAGSTLVPIGTNFGDPVSLRSRVVVGRLHSCDLPINDASVSREHARLSRLSGGYVLEDLGSTNGTLVNGRRIDDATMLHPGDTVTFGSVAFRYEEESPQAAETTLPPPSQTGSNGDNPDLPALNSRSSLGDLQAAAVASWDAEPPDAVHRRQGDDRMSLVTPFADGTSGGPEVDEALEISKRLNSLVQDLAARLATSEAESLEARRRAGSAENLERAQSDVRAAVERAQTLAIETPQVEEVKDAIQALADAPRDIDVLRDVADRAPGVLAVVESYVALRALFEELSATIKSAGTS